MSEATKEELIKELKDYGVSVGDTISLNQLKKMRQEAEEALKADVIALEIQNLCIDRPVTEVRETVKDAKQMLVNRVNKLLKLLGKDYGVRLDNDAAGMKAFLAAFDGPKTPGAPASGPASSGPALTGRFEHIDMSPTEFCDTPVGVRFVAEKLNEVIKTLNAHSARMNGAG